MAYSRSAAPGADCANAAGAWQASTSKAAGMNLKAVVDIKQGIMAVGGEMHADEEALLLDEGSPQPSLWGINLYPAQFGTPRFIEFDSVINIRPRQGNRTRSVDDAAVRATVTSIVARVVVR